MKKRIGIVGEGPTDFMVLRCMIDQITDEDNDYLRIQPEQDMTGEFGNGWKGVWNWCESTGHEIDRLMEGIIPKIDIVVIQMDGDVSRKEKEIHCACRNAQCSYRDLEKSPLRCRFVREGLCPVVLPCDSHDNTPKGYRNHIKNCILQWMGLNAERRDIIITVPCDSTDAWVMAAFDPVGNIEMIKNPWEDVISRKKEYHGIRIPGHKKNIRVYRELISVLEQNWRLVTEVCESAKRFEYAVKEAWQD